MRHKKNVKYQNRRIVHNVMINQRRNNYGRLLVGSDADTRGIWDMLEWRGMFGGVSAGECE